ncbi:phage baseplate assembly protein V [Pseudomonas sp. 57B-090624]|uniref:phage baseplate assembly protein V n=1 Tax=Pseudomonas sp. 57B-090624 TaxID=2213080 RepID=UPI000DA81D37|nr:phage baseplate assembly protein V [Pseudomonas sp. 57B-090624]PZE09703.1 phage baseplate assembly protein V [Pseudomonas sp. 57B-090624]
MTTLATLSRLIENLIRLGTVAEVDLATARVRIQSGRLLTGWLPWLALRAGEDRVWNPPTEGEQVLVLSPSGQTANGVVLCGLFSDAIPANGETAALHRTTYRDGAVIEYDSAAHHLRAILPGGGSTELVSSGGITLVGDVTHEGNYNQTGDYILVGDTTQQGDYNQTGDLSQTGDQNVTGTVAVGTEVVAAGVSLVKHLHLGNLGAPTSPPL